MADVKKQQEDQGGAKRGGRIRFPLAFKLSLAVSVILIFSFGITIFSVWFLFRFVFEDINNIIRWNIYFAVFVWFISLIIINIFSFSLTKRLGVLKNAAEAIENGYYSLNIPDKAHDEIGFLAGRMNNMRNSLINYEKFTNKQAARLTGKGVLAPEGTIKNAAFLFSNIRSFTEIAENMEPAELAGFLSEYMERMAACVIKTGGAVDNFSGDAILAHWGVIAEDKDSNDEEKNIKASLRCALLMRATLKCFNLGVIGKKRPYIRAGIGLSYGKAAAGLIGTKERFVYSVTGEAVSRCEKVEADNQPCGTDILITAQMAKAAKDDFILEKTTGNYYALINVKGKEEYRLITETMESLPGINMSMAKHCAGAGGPVNLKELRVLLGITKPQTA